ncbi:unnamed protein product [Plutella xylostella]|uniref:(diamondback moth) hypothetical protein n=1 Tax=Plutella xylostella TaxID=51655 RepID=A0A8S4ET64_PLUXY|nr:unnamed protein product [Plutella xylostella]
MILGKLNRESPPLAARRRWVTAFLTYKPAPAQRAPLADLTPARTHQKNSRRPRRRQLRGGWRSADARRPGSELPRDLHNAGSIGKRIATRPRHRTFKFGFHCNSSCQ